MPPTDACGYRAQAASIDDYAVRNAPESEIPFTSDPSDYPEGCSFCGPSRWEYRRLSDGRNQARCTGCGSISTERSR